MSSVRSGSGSHGPTYVVAGGETRERVLDRVLGLRHTAQHPVRKTEQPIAMFLRRGRDGVGLLALTHPELR